MNYFLFISILGTAESLCPPINDLTSSRPPFSAWLLHQRPWLGRRGQPSRSPRWYLIETSVEDRVVNIPFEIAWGPGEQARAEDSINATTLLSVRSRAEFSVELHGQNGCVYAGKERQGVFMALKSSSTGCLLFTLFQKTSRRLAMSTLPRGTHARLFWSQALSLLFFLMPALSRGLCCSGFATWPVGCARREVGGEGTRSRAKAAGGVWRTVSGGLVPSGAISGRELPPEPSRICISEPAGMVQKWARERKLSRTATRVQDLGSAHGFPV